MLKNFLTLSILSILSIVSCHKVVNLNNQYICTQIIENINKDRQIKEFQEFSKDFPLFSLHFINKESEILYRDSFERSLKRVNEAFNFPVFGVDKISAYNIFIMFKKDASVKALGGVRECGTNEN